MNMNNNADRSDWKSALVCALAVSILAGWAFVAIRVITGLAGLVGQSRFFDGINL
jgi:hypothetical protein